MIDIKIKKVKDNKSEHKNNFKDISHLTSKIENKTLEQLQREGIFIFPDLLDKASDITEEQKILQCMNEEYHTGNVMGFIGYQDERLIIESRFSTGNHDYFFQYLLAKVLKLPNLVNLNTDVNQDNGFSNLLILLFPAYLKSAMRKGIFKKYKNLNYNDANVKGTIDIKKHIILNTPFIGKIAYTKREYSYDNYVIELIRHTIEHIKKKSNRMILNTIKDEVNAIIAATPNYNYYDKSKIIAENQKNIVHHGYYSEYRTLQQLCLFILTNKKSNLGYGHNQFYGILFDGSWLWEEYINTLIDNMFHHPRNRLKEGTQYLFSTLQKKVGPIYPDFISYKEEKIIADAKYKPIENIRNEDYLQLLAYMFRFDAKQGYYIYPENNSEQEQNCILYLNQGTSYDKEIKRDDICVTKYGMKIPTADCYDDFVFQMMQYEEEIKEYFSSIINTN